MTEPELQVVSPKPVLNYIMTASRIIHFHSATCLWIRQGCCWMWLRTCCCEWHQARRYRWIFPAFRTGSSLGPFVSYSLFLSFFSLLTGLATAQYLCAACLQPVLHSSLSHKSFSGQTEQKPTYQCYYVPAPVFQYIGAQGGTSPSTSA